MRKFTKICLVLVAVCVIFGCVGMGVAIASGITMDQVAQWSDHGRIFAPWTDYDDLDDIHDFDHESLGDVEGALPASEVADMEKEAGDITYEEKFSGVTRLSVNAALSAVFISTGEGDDVVVKARRSTDGLKCYMEKDELKVKDTASRKEKRNLARTLGGNSYATVIYIQLPENISLKEVDLEADASYIEVRNSMSVEELDLEANAASIIWQGEITREAGVSANAANIEMEITGKQQDFNYEVEASVGNVEIGQEQYSGLHKEQIFDNGASKKIELDCNAGNINLTFK